MEPIIILLDSIAKIKSFINDMHKLGCDFKLVGGSGTQVIDSKNIMSIFTLDISKPVQFVTLGLLPNEKKVREILKPYIV